MADRASKGTFGADSGRFEQLVPLCLSSCDIGDRQGTLKALAIAKNDRIAAYREGDRDFRAGSVNADRGSRPARIGGPAVRLFDLEQLHVISLRAA